MKQTFDTGYIRRDTNDNTFEFITFESTCDMFRSISKIICFDDLDDTYEVVDIFCEGRKVKYVGWQPAMHFEYRFTDNNELAWEGWFEHWDH